VIIEYNGHDQKYGLCFDAIFDNNPGKNYVEAVGKISLYYVRKLANQLGIYSAESSERPDVYFTIDGNCEEFKKMMSEFKLDDGKKCLNESQLKSLHCEKGYFYYSAGDLSYP
jgi:predicted component of viral defense system (DUF524 family)